MPGIAGELARRARHERGGTARATGDALVARQQQQLIEESGVGEGLEDRRRR